MFKGESRSGARYHVVALNPRPAWAPGQIYLLVKLQSKLKLPSVPCLEADTQSLDALDFVTLRDLYSCTITLLALQTTHYPLNRCHGLESMSDYCPGSIQLVNKPQAQLRTKLFQDCVKLLTVHSVATGEGTAMNVILCSLLRKFGLFIMLLDTADPSATRIPL